MDVSVIFQEVVAISVRTSGLDASRDHLLEIAAVRRSGNGSERQFSRSVRPARAVSAGADHVEEAAPGVRAEEPAATAAVADLVAFLPAESLCLAHGAAFVNSFLEAAAGNPFPHALLDTPQLAAMCFPLLPGHSLVALAELPRTPEKELLEKCEMLLHLWDQLLDKALSWPRPLTEQFGRLLKGGSNHALQRFLDRISEVYATPGDRAERGGPASLFREEDPPRRRSQPRETPEIEPVDVDSVVGSLDQYGAFAREIPGYEQREEQLSMARAVSEALNCGHHLMVEAGTGVGKSLAYLVPSVLWSGANDAPVVVSTNTKNLQSQLFERDLPLIRRALRLDFRAALIKGRSNYLCIRKLLYLLRHAESELDRGERNRLLGVLAWASATTDGDMSCSSLMSRHGALSLAGALSSIADECPGPDCQYRRRCFLYRARRKALASDIVVANHALVFAEMGMGEGSPALPPYLHIVFDEAHNLEEAATRFFSIEVSTPRLRRLTRRLWRGRRSGRGRGLIATLRKQLASGALSKDGGGAVAGLCDRVGDRVGELDDPAAAFFAVLETLLRGAGRDDSTRIRAEPRPPHPWGAIFAAKEAFVGAIARLTQALDRLTETMADINGGELPFHLDFVRDFAACAASLSEFIQDIEFVLAASAEDHVYWVERTPGGRYGIAAWAAPIDVGPRLAQDLYEAKRTVVFCSATLTVGGQFDFLKGRLGIGQIGSADVRQLSVGSPFDYQRQCVVAVPMFLPKPNEDGADYPAKLAGLMADVFRRTHGRALALFTSYKMLKDTTSVLRERLTDSTITVLAQGESGSRESILEVFRRDLESVLMGTHSFWEGIDVVGESLSCLIVARLPFAVVTDPVFEARCEAMENRGVGSFYGYTLPSAVIRLRQGFGRLIRHRTDRGVVMVTDARIVSSRYGEQFRKSLPVAAVPFTAREELLDGIERFLHE